MPQLELHEKAPWISACIIAKNESAEIARWLASAGSYSDEIVFVDTGSTDDTRQIAASAGAIVYEYPWQDDFAAARNFALEKALGEWIVFLDADEIFFEPHKVRAFLQALECRQSEIEAVAPTIINIDADAHDLEIQRFQAVRIWRNRPGRRYIGCIHEAVYDDGMPLQQVLKTKTLSIRHTGYSSSRVRQKLRRNLQMLQQKICQNDQDSSYYRYLADCYYGLRDYSAALHYAMLDIEKGPQTLAGKQDMYWVVLRAMKRLDEPLKKQLVFATGARERFPGIADFYASEGILQAGLGQNAAARRSLEHFLACLADAEFASSTCAYAILPEVYTTLAKLDMQEGDTVQAEVCLRRALRQNPYAEDSLEAWLELRENVSVQRIADELSDFLPETPETFVFLQRWSCLAGALDLYAYYTNCKEKISGKSRDLCLIYNLLLQNSLESAYNQVLEEASHTVRELFVAVLSCSEDLSSERWIKIMPLGLQRVIARFQGRLQTLQEQDWDSYKAGLSSLAGLAEPRVMDAYAELAADFSFAQIQEAAVAFMGIEQWETAFGLYQLIPQDAAEADGGIFWFHVGVCLYHLHNSAATECFARAEAAGYAGKDLLAYQTWLETGGIGK